MWASLVAQLVKNPWFNCWVRKILWRRERLPTPVFLGFPGGSAGTESACDVGDLGSIPGLGRSPGGRKGYPLQYYGLEISMDCIVHEVIESDTTWATFTHADLFLSVLSLICSVQAFSSFSLLSCASHRSGFSYWGPWALKHLLHSCGTWA